MPFLSVALTKALYTPDCWYVCFTVNSPGTCVEYISALVPSPQSTLMAYGPTPPEKREQIKKAFNASPENHPVRILIATDAAREGLNLQAHCHNLFHFDLPWNPSRIEQRNGRIDRKLQPSPKVYCHYFVYVQRPEDRVLQALMRKTKTIREELGSLSEVLESRLAETLKSGISHDQVSKIAAQIEKDAVDDDKIATTKEELDVSRERHDELKNSISLLERRVEDARKWIGLDMQSLRDAIDCSLEMLGAETLNPISTPKGQPEKFSFPNIETRQGGDPTWITTLDTLRSLPEEGEYGFQWRKNAKIRPIVFQSPDGVDDSVVQLHLHHRVVQRLLGRFMSQGFVHTDLSRACLAHCQDNIPRVILLGRLTLYGPGASRLHEEILTVAARWSDADKRKNQLTPYASEAESKTIELLEESLKPTSSKYLPGNIQEQLQNSISRDIDELLPHLRERGQNARISAEKALTERGQAEAKVMRRILEEQKKRILAELDKQEGQGILLHASDDEKRQYESNRRYWKKWIENVQGDLEREPARIINFYNVTSYRIEPVGLVYLYPAGA